jgi:hypothetical protein
MRFVYSTGSKGIACFISCEKENKEKGVIKEEVLVKMRQKRFPKNVFLGRARRKKGVRRRDRKGGRKT